MVRGAHLDGTQFCFGYQDQTKITQHAKRLQSLKCLMIGISTLDKHIFKVIHLLSIFGHMFKIFEKCEKNVIIGDPQYEFHE